MKKKDTGQIGYGSLRNRFFAEKGVCPVSEKYERLFALPKNLYAAEAPVIISAGALLKDTATGKLVARLKYRNISLKPVKAIRVMISPLDAAGKPSGEDISGDYPDLNIRRDMESGQRKAIPVPYPSTRSYRVRVTEVVFQDHEIWHDTGKSWLPAMKCTPLEEQFGRGELLKQYRIQYGEKAKYIPKRTDSFWLCTCGAVNNMDEEGCHVCGNNGDALFDLNFEMLKSEAIQRVKQERAEQREKEEKRKKLLFVLIPVIAVIALLCFLYAFIFS